MLLPIKWLNDYCEIDVDTKTLANLLTDTGSHVDEIIDRDKNISGVFTGKIVRVESHPQADKLVVCRVDLGGEDLVIVTGAPNVSQGIIVPVAKVGARLPGGIEIKATDFRGIESEGMMCSLTELGFDQSVIPKEARDGLYIFDEDTPLGLDVRVLLDLDWDTLDIEITPNRPDCLSIIGMARETKATLKKPLKDLTFKIEREVEDINHYLESISIETPTCNRYYSRVIKDVDVKPSPQWIKNYLMTAGVRPINNIVDITNFVMLEYGLPLHAFDIEEIRGRKIKVHQARDGEEFTTLDGQIRSLTKDDMVIADAEGPIGIAGIMGGLDSGVKSTTRVIVLEGANFDGPSIRYTSKRLNLRTEASTRFEKGLDPELAKHAVDRACELIEEIGAGVVVKGYYDLYENKITPLEVGLRPGRVNMLLGIDLTKTEIAAYLQRLDIDVRDDGENLVCRIPSFRRDITIEADLIEEVGRLYGLNNIKPTEIYTTMTRGSKPYFRSIQKTLKATLKGIGYNEILTYSFISPSSYDKLMIPDGDFRRDYVKILNPLGEEYSVMRTTLLGNILEVISKNQNRNIEEMKAYEIGNTFSPTRDENGIPTEGLKLVLALYGQEDFYFLKETMEKSFAELGIRDFKFQRETDNPIFHPGRCAKVLIGDKYLGTFGEVHPLVMKNFEIKHRTLAGEFDFKIIVDAADEKRTFKPLPKYPASERDLAVLVDEEVMVSQIKKVVEKQAGDLLESFKVFDIYTGDQVKEGKKSIAFKIKFRSLDRTLKDEEVNKIIQSTIKSLEEEVNAELRV